MSKPRSAGVVVWGSVAALAMWGAGAVAQQPLTTPADAKEDLRHARALSRAFNRAAETIAPSVVHITQINRVRFRRDWFSNIEQRDVETGAGSGVIVSADGYILTNNHVIDNAQRVQVTLSDGRKLAGKIVGADPATDLGVVKIEPGDAPLTPAQFGDSDGLVVGDWVIAVGSAFGIFDNTVTAGIVSAKGRTNLTGPADSYQDFIQTDAAVNPGNSGGPLVDLEGRVVGINSQIASRSGGFEGLSFAIPAAIAQPVMQMLVKSGRVERGWVGISRSLKPPVGGQGVLLDGIVPGGPGDQAGLQIGDVVLRYNGRVMDNSNRLRTAIAVTPPGTSADVEVQRGTQKVMVSVKVADATEGRAMAPGGSALLTYGFTVTNLTAADSAAIGESGVVVSSIDDSGPAARAGLRVNDVIVHVNQDGVATVEDFDRLMKSRRQRLRLDVVRPTTGQKGYLDVQPRR